MAKSTKKEAKEASAQADHELVDVNGEPHYKTVDEDGNEVLKSV